MAASGDNLAARDSCVKGNWRRRFKRCLCICCESNASNLAEEAEVQPIVAQSSNLVGDERSNNADLVEEQLGIDADAQRSNPAEEPDEEQGSNRDLLEADGTLATWDVEALDKLLNEIKAKIQGLSSSTAPASSSSKLQCIIGRKDIISSFMKSFPDDVKKEVNRAGGAWLMPLVKDALGGVGAVHWVGLGMSLVAWALDNIEQTSQNRDDCVKILQRIVPVLISSKEIWQANAIKEDSTVIEILQDTVWRVFRCTIVCSSLLNDSFLLRFLKVSSVKDAIASLNGDLDLVVEQLDLFIKTRIYVSNLPKQGVCFDSDDDDDSVGGSLEAQQKAMEYLERDQHDTKAVCLYGMGGIGKSTDGLCIYKKFQKMPSYRCCMVQLSFGIKDEELHKIQKQILEVVCGTKGEVHDSTTGKEKLKQELKKINHPIFLYMDNVLEAHHMCELLPKEKYFPRGSRILVTTRYEAVQSSMVNDLEMRNCELIEVMKWKENLAKRLLWKHICGQEEVEEVGCSGIQESEARVLKLCDGLPLALKVVGRHIKNDERGPRDLQVWKEVQEAMEHAKPLDGAKEDELYHRLMFSVDILHKDSRGAFLDIIAFGLIGLFYNSWQEVERLVGGHTQLEALRKRALVQKRCTEDGRHEYVEVHDVLKEMGEQMIVEDKEVRIRSGEELEKLNSDSLANVVGLMGRSKKLNVEPHQLKQMSRLRMLRNVHIRGECAEITHLSCDLLVVRAMRSETLRPFSFSECSKLKELEWACADTNESNLEFLRHIPKGLEILNLSHCDGLANAEGISNLTKLKQLELWDCRNLQSLPDEISSLTGLVKLDLGGCHSLQSLPQGISELKSLEELSLSLCDSLQSLPQGISELKSLEVLSLSYFKSLQSLPDGIFARLTGLVRLDLRGCESLQSLPQGISELKSLERLNLSNCKSLQSLPHGIFARSTGLVWLDLRGCESLQSLPQGISELKSLKRLRVQL